MNNDNNNYNGNGENQGNNNMERTPFSEEVPNTPPVNDFQQNANGDHRSDTNGSYSYSGERLGDNGRDDMSEVKNTPDHTAEGSFTYKGSYGQNPSGGNPMNNGYANNQFNNQYDNRYNGWNNGNNQYGGMNGGFNPPPGNPMQEPFVPGGMPFTPPPPKKKKKNGGMVAALIVTIAVSVILSGAAGFGGAYLYNYMYAEESGGSFESGSQNGGNDTTVLHRVVETDESTSTGEKGVYTDVASIVKDSVVEITTEFKVTGFFQFVSEGAGSGVIISEDGYIITNNHVISDSESGDPADKVTVRLTNGKEYKAKLVGRDADSDIAVIKIEPDEKLTFAVFGNSDNLTVGEEVIAVGNPLGELGGTVTNGIISALDREINVDGTKMNLLQTNAAINPGNSGGGLFNMKGELIGVVNAKSSGSGIEGLGFAIPANDAFDVAEQLMENGYVTGKVYLGVSFYDITDAYTAYRYFRSQATGVYVVELAEGYNDGVLEYGDRIVAIDGDEITEFSQIKDILKDHEVGDTLAFSIHRSGKLMEVTVTCFEYVPEDANVDFDSKK